ncbi:alpha-glucosidase [Corynebacterium sp. zg-331]|uniref:alpha-glucosidase n=1 Tax=unclassified Corynebacterium TaxID=2624378 RepID=UPI00128E37D1|nr:MULTISPECIES: alpha-glucosidase [unclassified Corynebacterium]MBC3185979.1 alpha-glucosidase [Corynebacterium sp. zg-331]MPV52470.1 alpha,alpha-phosphotrehalase [Corynebacterium sp. zg331]
MGKNEQLQWWHDAVVYQIYPRSFRDSNGDGIGDIPGIIQQLPYLKELGVDILWLCPVYCSPNDDNGYDISDYRDIMPEYGTLGDFDELLARAHEMGLKIMMDLVVNHTSDEHEWFLRSRESKDNPHRDYYIWRDPAGYAEDGTPLPPNNWGSEFGGSAWEWDERTGQFYLHMFSRKQPDLNWENPAVREEIVKMIRWWQERGVDGWRVDAIGTADKPEGFPDDPHQESGRVTSSMRFVNNRSKVHTWLHLMNREAWSLGGEPGSGGVVTVGELDGPTPREGVLYTAPEREELNQIIHFQHVSLGNDPRFGKWSLKRPALAELKEVLDSWQLGLHGAGWNALYWENHDQPRAVSRFGDDRPEFRAACAKALATVLYLQQGTPYIYQGQELGMVNAAFESIEDYRDFDSLNWYRTTVGERGELDADEALARVHARGRDNARTPMQWSALPQAGFSGDTPQARPWIEVNPTYAEINAAAQQRDHASVLNYYRRLLRLRKTTLREVVREGTYEPIAGADPCVYSYQCAWGTTRLVVAVNFTSRQVACPGEVCAALGEAEALLSNYEEEAAEEILRPWEARVVLREE